MSRATPTWAHIIADAIEDRLIDVHTALPGRIQSYNPEKQTADVELQILRPIENIHDQMTFEDYPLLPNIPIAFPRSTNFFISFPLTKGDFVLVVFLELSPDTWRSKGSKTAPNDCRRLSITGGVAIPCLFPNTKALSDVHADDMVMGEEGGVHIHLKSGGTAEVTSGGEATADNFVAMAGKVLSELENIESAFNDHVHLVTSIGGNTGGPLGGIPPAPVSYSASGVQSSNLKADD